MPEDVARCYRGEGWWNDATPTLETVRAHLAGAGLARQKWPESLHEVSDFPRTPSGKVQKFRLRQQLRDGAVGVGPS
jgi:non-ribosomal peptide synthetase component E (peptide arylation enzyme)